MVYRIELFVLIIFLCTSYVVQAQDTLSITIDKKLYKEMDEEFDSFYLIIDSVLYPLIPQGKIKIYTESYGKKGTYYTRQFQVPKRTTTLLDSGKLYYYYFETKKYYYWVDLIVENDDTFLGKKEFSSKGITYLYKGKHFNIHCRRGPSYSNHIKHSTTLEALNFQKKYKSYFIPKITYRLYDIIGIYFLSI